MVNSVWQMTGLIIICSVEVDNEFNEHDFSFTYLRCGLVLDIKCCTCKQSVHFYLSLGCTYLQSSLSKIAPSGSEICYFFVRYFSPSSSSLSSPPPSLSSHRDPLHNISETQTREALNTRTSLSQTQSSSFSFFTACLNLISWLKIFQTITNFSPFFCLCQTNWSASFRT